MAALVSLTSVLPHLSTSAANHRNVRNRGDDFPTRRKYAYIQPSCQERTGNGNDDDDYAHFPSKSPPSGALVVVTVNVTGKIDKIRLFLGARRLAAMHQNGSRLDFIDIIDARYGGRNDTALAGW